MQRERSDDEGCKHRGQVAGLLEKLIIDYWRYFDKNGRLNSDGRRLAAKVARIASRGRCRSVSALIYRLLNNSSSDDLSELVKIVERLGYEVDVTDVEASIYGPVRWRWRDTYK